MTGWSAVAGTHNFTAPDEKRARAVAGALSAYGFVLVIGRPDRFEASWTVVAGAGPPARRVLPVPATLALT
jgi:hypothetical protein